MPAASTIYLLRSRPSQRRLKHKGGKVRCARFSGEINYITKVPISFYRALYLPLSRSSKIYNSALQGAYFPQKVYFSLIAWDLQNLLAARIQLGHEYIYLSPIIMAAQTIQDFKALPKFNRINNLNDVLIKSIKQEDTAVELLESSPTMRNSPRTPRTDITTTSRRRRQHPKLKTVNQWSHLDSGANPLLNLSNTNTSEKSENDSAYGSNASTDRVFYNLIEYYGNDSSANKSEFHIQNMSNTDSEMVRVNQNSILGSPGTKFVNVEDMRVKLEDGTARKYPKKIVFLVPAELEAFVEILKVQSIAAVKTQVENVPSAGDAVFSGIDRLPTTSKTTLPSSTPDPEVSDFRGPIKRQMKKNKKKRNAPYYARRIVQNCDKENHHHQRQPHTVKDSSNARYGALDNNVKLEIPKSYVQQDFQQTHGSAGPIRSKASYYRNGAYKQTTPPPRSYSNSSIGNNTRTNGYSYSQNPGMDLFSRDRNDRNKPYYNSKLRKVKLCWICQSDYHLSKQCPFA